MRWVGTTRHECALRLVVFMICTRHRHAAGTCMCSRSKGKEFLTLRPEADWGGLGGQARLGTARRGCMAWQATILPHTRHAQAAAGRLYSTALMACRRRMRAFLIRKTAFVPPPISILTPVNHSGQPNPRLPYYTCQPKDKLHLT